MSKIKNLKKIEELEKHKSELKVLNEPATPKI